MQTHFHTQVSAERKRACARIMAQRYANGSAWDLYGSGCGFKQLPRSVPVEKCVRVASAAAPSPGSKGGVAWDAIYEASSDDKTATPSKCSGATPNFVRSSRLAGSGTFRDGEAPA